MHEQNDRQLAETNDYQESHFLAGQLVIHVYIQSILLLLLQKKTPVTYMGEFLHISICELGKL